MSPLRSLLFVPGDSERKLEKGDGAGADALILDLEDAVAPQRKAHARGLVAEYLGARSTPRSTPVWVRVNPVDLDEFEDDLAAVASAAPDGIVLPKARSAADVVHLHDRLGKFETRGSLEQESIQIIAIVTETPAAIFSLGQYHPKIPRLAGLSWGAEDLSAAIGAADNKDADGRWLAPFELARSLTLLAAHAAEVGAIDTLFADFRDEDGLRASAVEGRRLGFTGKLAIHPAQVDIINTAFMPAAEEIVEASRIVAAFAAAPDAGAVGLDGRMLDIPHLKRAQRLLALADVDKAEPR